MEHLIVLIVAIVSLMVGLMWGHLQYIVYNLKHTIVQISHRLDHMDQQRQDARLEFRESITRFETQCRDMQRHLEHSSKGGSDGR